ncbi:hypothetical protein [Lysinibacillus telephonicus]|uniref:hypothetical protein n=1 Tax=Lysinibacillus telephonicus TaxID=1714840 RepID=UPI0037D56084
MQNEQLQVSETTEPKLFTQSELDEILQKRLRRERMKSTQVIRSLLDYIQTLNEEVRK